MANQPPVRPWFRLASLRSVSAPPAPEPRPSLVQPTIRTNPQPTQPQAQPTPQPPPAPADKGSSPSPSPSPSPQKAPAKFSSSSSLPNSPVQKAPLTTFSANPSSSSSLPNSPAQKVSLTTFSANPSSSPAKGLSPSMKPVVQSPKQSPKFKPITPPTSPLTLPPSQLKANSEIEPKIPIEAEAKNVIVQKTIKNPNQWHNSNSGETLNLKAYSEKQNGGNQKKISDPEDFGMKVITIAGENRGAYMELIRSPNKHEFVGEKKPNYLYKKGKSEWESSSSDEGNANKINRGKSQSSYPMAAFMNSNVQCVNNSILYNASCTHKDPGVRLSLSKKPFEGEGFHFKEVR